MPSLSELLKEKKLKEAKEKEEEIKKSSVEITSKPKVKKTSDLIKTIDQSIDGIVNQRIMKLVKIGLKHELSIENMIQYFKEHKSLKLYNLTRYFSDAKPSDVNLTLKLLYNEGKLTKSKDGWFSLIRK